VLLNRFEKISDKKEEEKKKEKNNDEMDWDDMREEVDIIGLEDVIGRKKNKSGKNARLGENGKYYCGGPLDTPCFCCDGFCGPASGCNCADCMELDMLSRKLPKGYLVNSAGFSSRKGLNPSFYCGTKSL